MVTAANQTPPSNPAGPQPVHPPEVIDALISRSPDALPADRPELHPEPGALATAAGQGLRALHDVDISSVDGWVDRADTIESRCRSMVASGRLDPATLPEPYCRYTLAKLLDLAFPAEEAHGGSGGASPDETALAERGDDLVVALGSPTLARFRVAGDRFDGFDRLAVSASRGGSDGVLLADRHHDLAVAHLDVAAVLGAEAVFALYNGYGIDPSLVALDRAIIAAHLRGVVPRQPDEPAGDRVR